MEQDMSIKRRIDELIESLELCETARATELIDELKNHIRVGISAGRRTVEVDADALEFLLVHIDDKIKQPHYRH